MPHAQFPCAGVVGCGTKGAAVDILKLMAVVTFAVTASTVGDLLLARGMRKVGQIKWVSFSGAWRTLVRVAKTPEVPLAIVCFAVFFFTWLALLSRADLSLVLPMTALTYLLNGLAAKPVLGETVSRRRWLALWVITVGVVLVTISGGSNG